MYKISKTSVFMQFVFIFRDSYAMLVLLKTHLTSLLHFILHFLEFLGKLFYF